MHIIAPAYASLSVSHLARRAQVSELTLMYQAAGHVHPPAHTMRARTVSDAMDNLVNLAKQVGKESPDKVTLHTTQKLVGVGRFISLFLHCKIVVWSQHTNK